MSFHAYQPGKLAFESHQFMFPPLHPPSYPTCLRKPFDRSLISIFRGGLVPLTYNAFNPLLSIYRIPLSPYHDWKAKSVKVHATKAQLLDGDGNGNGSVLRSRISLLADHVRYA